MLTIVVRSGRVQSPYHSTKIGFKKIKSRAMFNNSVQNWQCPKSLTIRPHFFKVEFRVEQQAALMFVTQ